MSKQRFSDLTSDRQDYLKELSENYNVPLFYVISLAEMLGENEDHDGLVSELEDFSTFFENDLLLDDFGDDFYESLF